MNKLLILLCSCCVLLQACSKSKPHYTIDAGMKAAFNYLPGTYWIYKDSISGRTDSFFVTLNSGMTSTTFNDITIEQIIIDMQEYCINNMATDTTTWNWILTDNYIYLQWSNNTYKDVNAQYGIFVTYPFRKGISNSNNGIIKTDSNSFIANIDTQYALNGIIYDNVAEISQTFSSIDSLRFNDWFCFNVDAGIIKMRLDHPHFLFKRVWELQRYHVVK